MRTKIAACRADVLVVTLRQELERSPTGQASAPASEDKRPLLLVVDPDTELAEQLAVEAVTRGIRAGIKLTTLDDPQRFWAVLQETSPDLLLLDVDMPHLNGIDLCQVVRNDQRWTEMPVLFLTAHADADTIHRVFAAGADDCVSKPIIGPELLTRITNRLERTRLLRAFLFGRLGWNRLGGNLIISGAFGLFRREAMIAAGGYTHDTVGEDMELVLRLRRQGYEERGPQRVAFIPDPVAWTGAPESLRVLGRQRDRWHRGLADVMWRHSKLLFNSRYGAMGLVVYPYFFFVELLAPVVEAVGLLGLIAALIIGALNVPFAILFFLVAYGYGLVLSAVSLVLEELNFHRYEGLKDRLLLLLWTLLEPFGYRQLTVIWRLRGLIKFIRGRTDWGAMERRGFNRPG